MRIVALSLLLLATPVSAQDGSYMVFNGGLSSCGRFLTADPQLAQIYGEWAAGFMSGVSAATGSDLGGLRDVAGVVEGARRICEADPTRAYGTAVKEAVFKAAAR